MEQEGNRTQDLKKYARDGTAKRDRQLSENAQGVKSCQFSYFFTKPVQLLLIIFHFVPQPLSLYLYSGSRCT